MRFSSWQLAKFMVWLECQLTTAVSIVLLCDFLFWLQNRSSYRFFLSVSLWAYTLCLIYDFCRLKCPNAKTPSAKACHGRLGAFFAESAGLPAGRLVWYDVHIAKIRAGRRRL